MEISEKFKRIRKALGMRQAEFAKPLGISYKQISAIETGVTGPSGGVVELLFIKHGVSRQWWETGEGEMFVKKGKPQVPEHLRLLIDEVIAAFPTASSLVQKSESLSKVMRDLREAKD